MKLFDRLIMAVLLLIVAAAVLPIVTPPLITAAGVGTVCFVVIRAVLYVTRR